MVGWQYRDLLKYSLERPTFRLVKNSFDRNESFALTNQSIEISNLQNENLLFQCHVCGWYVHHCVRRTPTMSSSSSGLFCSVCNAPSSPIFARPLCLSCGMKEIAANQPAQQPPVTFHFHVNNSNNMPITVSSTNAPASLSFAGNVQSNNVTVASSATASTAATAAAVPRPQDAAAAGVFRPPVFTPVRKKPRINKRLDDKSDEEFAPPPRAPRASRKRRASIAANQTCAPLTANVATTPSRDAECA